MQKTALPFVACLLALAAAGVNAQTLWKWRDAAGQLHVSDTAPPPGTPAKNVISSPMAGPAPSASPQASSLGATGAAPASSGPSALDRKKMAAEQEKAEKDKAARAEAEAKNAAIRKDNCSRAKSALADLQSGQRIAHTNDKGEREFLDDAARAAETRRAQEIVTTNCSAPKPE